MCKKVILMVMIIITLVMISVCCLGCNKDVKFVLNKSDFTATLDIDIDGHDLGYVIPESGYKDRTTELLENIENCPTSEDILHCQDATAQSDDIDYYGLTINTVDYNLEKKEAIDSVIEKCIEIKNEIVNNCNILNEWVIQENVEEEKNSGTYYYNIYSKLEYDSINDITKVQYIKENDSYEFYANIRCTFDDNGGEVVTIDNYVFDRSNAGCKIFIVYEENVRWTCLINRVEHDGNENSLKFGRDSNLIDCDLSKEDTPVTDMVYSNFTNGQGITYFEDGSGYTIDSAHISLCFFDEYPTVITDISTGYWSVCGGEIRDDQPETYNNEFPPFAKTYVYNNDSNHTLLLNNTKYSSSYTTDDNGIITDFYAGNVVLIINKSMLSGWEGLNPFGEGSNIQYQQIKVGGKILSSEFQKYSDKVACCYGSDIEIEFSQEDFPTLQEVKDALNLLGLTPLFDLDKTYTCANAIEILKGWSAFGKTDFTDIRAFMVKAMINKFDENAETLDSIIQKLAEIKNLNA